MKILITVLLLCTSFYIGAQQNAKQVLKKDTLPQKNTSKTLEYYTCVMHPEIHSSKPGVCPKCGMTLIKKKIKPKDTKTVQLNIDPTTAPVNPSKEKINPPDVKAEMLRDSASISKPVPDVDISHLILSNKQSPMEQLSKDIPSMDHSAILKTIDHLVPPSVVRYELYIKDTLVNFTGKSTRAIAVNGSIPMPTLTFTEGDTAEITVHNMMDEETSLHWHGLFLPNQYDGVPNLTQMPIKPHSTHIYKFPIIQHGTHWYHSHTKLQEQIGMYGMFIINKRKEWDIPTIPVLISEWIDMNPKEVHRSLHAATDWFAVQKGSTQSYVEAIKQGHFKTKVANEWKRMNAMDLTDVFYDQFLLNGKNQLEQPQFKAGDKVRLRIANGGASDYFWLSYAGGKIIVVATDGNDVDPVEVDRLIIAVSETYDVIVTIPENKSYEFLVTPEDRTKHASLWLGSGSKVAAIKMKRPKYFAGMNMMNNMMDMKGNMIEMEGMIMQNQVMDMNTVMYPEITGDESPEKSNQKSNSQEHGNHSMQMPDNNSMQGMNMESENPDIITLNYTMLKAVEKTTLPAGPLKVLKFDLTGNMNRYVWTLDNKTVSESDKILIRKGENVRIILYNNSMMRHPMHLHGHDFRLLNGQGEYSPMKNIIDIMPMERDTIEFNANVYGDWFFHCHILYHMMSGMGRVFTYENQPANPEIPSPKLAQRKLFADDREMHLMGRIGIESNGSDGEAMLASTRWKVGTLWHLGYHDMHGYESETMVGRFLGRMQWWFPYIGYDYHYKVEGGPENIFGSESKNWFGQTSNKNNRSTLVAGIAYTLPMLFSADARIDGDGKFRFQLGREDIPVTKRLRWSLMINTDKEYMTGLRYIATKYISISSHYDSDMGLGAGITITY